MNVTNAVSIEEQKELARRHFDEKTKALGLEHTFSFDEAWNYAVVKRYRDTITEFEKRLRTHSKAVSGEAVNDTNPLRHSFADGCYIREVNNPAGEVIVTKIHRIEHPFFLLEGEMTVITEDGPKRLKAPYYGITKAGTKRVILTHTPCKFVTVHVTNETDLDKIERDIIAEDFSEFDKKEYDDLLLKLKEE